MEEEGRYKQLQKLLQQQQQPRLLRQQQQQQQQQQQGVNCRRTWAMPM